MKRTWMVTLGIGATAALAVLWVQRGSRGPGASETKSAGAENSSVANSNTGSGWFSTREPAAVRGGAATSSAQTSAGGSNANAEFRFAKELEEYTRLKAKVIMTDDEKQEKQRLLADTGFVRGLAALLSRPANYESEDFDRQNRALDLLFEALSTNSKTAAAEVLRGVVEDAQLENVKLDMGSRKALAGVKAEVLYNWAAMDPDRAKDIPTWLPGPVSERIWKNVIDMHEQNAAESMQEMPK